MTRALFVNQGRASAHTAMGIAGFHQLLQANWPATAGIDATFAQVAPFTLPERLLAAELPGLRRVDAHKLRWHLVRSLAGRRLLQAGLRRQRCDVAHITTDQVALLLGGAHAGVPVVIGLDTTTYDWVRAQAALHDARARLPRLRALALLERRALERAALTVAWTRTAADRVRDLQPGARVEVLHPGLDLEVYRPRADAAEPGPLRVLFVGGRWRDKGGPALVSALSDRLGSAVRLDVVTTADIPSRPGLHVHRAEPGAALIVELMQRADVFCLPTALDAAPLAVVEAMACGVPVVSTPLASIPELVGDTGVLVPIGDVRALRQTLHSLAADPDRRRALGAAARARAESTYDARANTQRLVALLERVAGADA